MTSLGIVIGITSVIILVAITDGAKNIIEQQLVSLGAKTIVLKPIGRTASGVYRGQAADFSQNELNDVFGPSWSTLCQQGKQRQASYKKPSL